MAKWYTAASVTHPSRGFVFVDCHAARNVAMDQHRFDPKTQINLVIICTHLSVENRVGESVEQQV